MVQEDTLGEAKTTEDIEVRWCTRQGLAFDRVATDLLELYIYYNLLSIQLNIIKII